MNEVQAKQMIELLQQIAKELIEIRIALKMEIQTEARRRQASQK